MLAIFVVVLSYLVGSIPAGMLLAKRYGSGDLRTQGSGNIGATNAWRVGGKYLGISTFVCDMLKGAIPVYLAQHYLGETIGMLAAIAAVVGHIFPVWLNFRGGRGVATTFAVITVIAPLIGLSMIIAWALTFWRTRISSLSSLVAIFIALSLSFLFPSIKIFITVLVLSALVVFRHNENIERLMQGTENRFEVIGNEPKL